MDSWKASFLRAGVYPEKSNVGALDGGEEGVSHGSEYSSSFQIRLIFFAFSHFIVLKFGKLLETSFLFFLHLFLFLIVLNFLFLSSGRQGK